MVTVADGRITGVESRELDVLRWAICQVDLSACETPEGVYAEVRQGFEHEIDQANGKIPALRLVLTGKSPVHAQLLDRTVQWTEEFRGIAAGLGDVWLEKVTFQTSRKKRIEDIYGEDTPIAGLLRSIQQLELDGATPCGTGAGVVCPEK